MMAMTWQESCVLSVVVGEGWRGSGGWIWRIMWRKAPSWRPPLTTIKIMHIYMINLAKLSFPVSFILHWLCTDHWAATRSPGPSLTWRDYSVLFFLLRQNGRRGLMITLFPGYLYLPARPSSCWLGGQKMFRNFWGSICYVIICYLNTIYAAEGNQMVLFAQLYKVRA